MAKTINIFGTKFAYPKGLRKSPGTNWFASCVAGELANKHPGSKAAVHQGFRSAAKACKSRGRSG